MKQTRFPRDKNKCFRMNLPISEVFVRDLARDAGRDEYELKLALCKIIW